MQEAKNVDRKFQGKSWIQAGIDGGKLIPGKDPAGTSHHGNGLGGGKC